MTVQRIKKAMDGIEAMEWDKEIEEQLASGPFTITLFWYESYKDNRRGKVRFSLFFLAEHLFYEKLLKVIFIHNFFVGNLQTNR